MAERQDGDKERRGMTPALDFARKLHTHAPDMPPHRFRMCDTYLRANMLWKEMEIMAEFASKGVANAGLTTGIIGSAGWLLNGGLNNILGGARNVGACGCNEDHLVNRYEAQQQARIAELETEVKLRDANTYTDQKLIEVYRYFDNKLEGVNASICQQAVYNATNTATISCLQNQVNQLAALTKVVIPTSSVCPEPMARYNSWTAPTATATAAG